ncbi:glycoside hydrolase family 97 protein [Thalassomonas viridans]|uniref:Glycoside hydrolase family 97 protein n=1 Tax=Thalassomonas viridans TaxID=137584 RepID=A0AAF0C9L9_9GAMM|nr:glycoside hydrolase family 97 protein [Thalassomonas viridans]WDE05923.1 glycoside hydrolase family 97 protein [Thalassomonas viridans]
MTFFRSKLPNKLSAGLLFTLGCGLLPLQAAAKSYNISSPDGAITLAVDDDNGPSYRVNFNGQPVIEASRLGMVFKDVAGFDSSFTITSVEKSQVNTSWQQPWGERKTVVDHHNELLIRFSADREQSNRYLVRFRVFNDGLGFRYEVPKQNGLTGKVEITDELTEFNIPQAEHTTAWWIPARGWNRYEYLYNTTPLSEIDRVHTPFTFKLKNQVHVSIHEAALVDYAAMTLDQQRTGRLKADLTPWSDGILVKTRADFNTPWRTLQISPDAVGLLNSDLILNLNEPSKIADTSWIKPGKYIGIWWGMHINETTWGSGDRHGATTAETKRYMDFAAENGFDGVLVEGWNIGWDGDWFFNGDIFNFTKSYDDFDLKAAADYGEKLGVKLIGHHETSGSVTNYRNQLNDAYDLYRQHGVSQIKTGYVADGGDIKRIDENGVVRHEWHDGQFTIGEYLHSVKEAAKRKISINTHEPIKDTGLRRTYPNWLSREGARGQEFNAWANPANGPEHTAMLPFTRMLAGPMDFTPGIFNFDFNANSKEKAGIRPQTTLAKQLALYVVLYSPVQMAADLPRNYQANLPAFQFIKDVPTDWENSRALAGEVGDYVVFTRQERDGDDWYLGALTDEAERKVEVALNFLEPGRQYQAQIYRDGDKAHWLNNPYDMVIEQKTVTAKDKLTLALAASGGSAIRFKLLK